MTTYNVLLVGLGRIGWSGFGSAAVETHYEAITQHPQLRLVAGVDASQPVRIGFQGATHLPVYEDAIVAAKQLAPHIAVIATPPETHRVLGTSLAPHLRGAVIEKPLALTVPDCADLIAAYRGKALVVGHQRRYEQRHRLLRAFLKSGVLGEPRAALCTFSGDYLNNGVHAADAIRFVAPPGIPSNIRRADAPEFRLCVSCERGNVDLSSYGDLAPGYLRAMYDDLIECIESGKCPECSGEDGLEAVREALLAEEFAAYRESVA